MALKINILFGYLQIHRVLKWHEHKLEERMEVGKKEAIGRCSYNERVKNGFGD